MKTYLLVDGKNLLWRAESAMSALSSFGRPTGGMHGFLSMLLRVVDRFKADRLVICWDDWKNGPAARKRISPDYKKRDASPQMKKARDEISERVALQQRQLMDLFKALDVKQARSPEWEADDVMGTLARRYGKTDRVLILTGDQDLLQCVSKNVTVLRPQPAGEFKEETPESVFEGFGVKVSQFIEYKALIGDSSDGYKGVPGIGAKGAASLLAKSGNARDAVAFARGNNDPVVKKLVAHYGEFEMCKQLATINVRAPLKFLKREKDDRAVVRQLKQLEMRQLLNAFSNLKALAWGEP